MSDTTTPPATDWGNLDFSRRRPYAGHAFNEDPGATRFAIGLATFLLVALLYPAWSYWVQSRLLAIETRAALEQVERELAHDRSQARARAAAGAESMRARLVADRLRRVSVTGISRGDGKTVAIVDLGATTLPDAKSTICRQLWRRERQGIGGPIEIRRFRGRLPAITVGTIDCDRL